MAHRSYRRRISSEEAREGYLLILKRDLGLFPRPGDPFTLATGGASCRARIEAEPCTCRGPELPHEHYRIRWPGLRAGQHIEIEEDASAAAGSRLRRYEIPRRVSDEPASSGGRSRRRSSSPC